MCLTNQATEKDPRQGTAWMGRAMEKEWPKRPYEHQLQEARKERLWYDHNSCGGGSPCPCTLGTARVPASQAAVPSSHSALTGAELPQLKCSLASLPLQGCFHHVPLFVICRLWPARLLCWGVLQARILEHVGQHRLPHPSRALYFLLT